MWWGDVNQPITPEIFDDLYDTAVTHMNSKDKVRGGEEERRTAGAKRQLKHYRALCNN